MNCEICGVSDSEKQVRKIRGKYLCSRHITQLYRNGKFLDITIYDSNGYIMHEDYAEIVLRDKHSCVVGVAIIDIEDVGIAKQYKWHMRKSLNTNYAACTLKDGQKLFLHRLVLGYSGKDDVDHIDHNGLNNRKSNLRVVTHDTNLRNQHGNRKGVKRVGSGNYQAIITKDSKNIYLGTFPTYESALEARLKAEKELENIGH